MSEELLQRGLHLAPEKIGHWRFYNIGSTTLKALKNYKIIPNKDYKNFETRKPDGLIVDKHSVIAVIENKNISKFKTLKDKQKAVQQGIEIAQILGAKLVIASDSVNTTWINALNGEEIIDEKGREIKTVFNPKDPDIAKLIEKIADCIRVDNSELLEPRLKDPTKLAKSVWQDLWSVSGATPENCLYTFVELFIFKYLSDLEVLKGRLSYKFLMGQFQEETEEEVLGYYANTIRKKIKELFPASTIDGTTVINGTIFVSKDDVAVKGYGTVFKKILTKFGNEKEGGGELTNIDKDFKSKLFETFLKESISKKNLGQFFTPLKVVKAMVKMAESDIKPGISICDPACGVGKFLLESLIVNDNIEDFFDVKNGELIPKIKLWGVDKGFDKDEQRTIILAKANTLIYLSDLIRKHTDITSQFAKFFNDSFELKNKNILGTLQDTKKDEFDLILANPPYVTSGSSNLKDEIAKNGDLQVYYKINGMGVEGLFMEWIIQALRPGGKAFIVVPDGIFNRQNDKNLRQFIIEECFIEGIISLPIKTFFTTPKKTYILVITKKQNKGETQKDPVFTYLVSEIGESRDIYRFNIEQNDLQNSVELFNAFKGNKDYFVKNNIDLRCKLQPFEQFNPEEHWSIDRWWTQEEKINLGIMNKKEAVTLKEFGETLIDISETLKEYADLMNEVAEKKKNINKILKINLEDKKCFELFIGKRVLKKDIINIKEGLPIYSANPKNIIGYGLKSSISDFSKNFVIWGIDGDFEFNVISKKNKFIPTDHCGVIKILNEGILPQYLMIQLDLVKNKYGFDRGLRSSLKNMRQIEISIPYNENGEIDVEKQQEVIEKYEYVEELKKKIEEYKKQVQDLKIEITNDYGVKDIKINEIFEIKKGKSIYTNTYVKKHDGVYPLYSSQTTNDGVIGLIDTFDFDENCLTWTTDGIYAGTVFVRKGKFSMTTHCGALIIKSNIQNINNEYLYSYLCNNLKAYAIGEQNKRITTDIIKNILIPIPVTQLGEFDLEAQQEIAHKYKKVEQIKQSILTELNKIVQTEIEF